MPPPPADDLLISTIRHEGRSSEEQKKEAPLILRMVRLDKARVRTFLEAKNVPNLGKFP